MSGKSLGQVEVFTFEGERYVVGESLAKAVGAKPESVASWSRRQIKKYGLIFKKDWIETGEGILFVPEVAIRIFNEKRKIETEPRKHNGRRNPIIPSRKRQLKKNLAPWYILLEDRPLRLREKEKSISVLYRERYQDQQAQRTADALMRLYGPESSD